MLPGMLVGPWPVFQCDLYRSSDKQNFSLINTQYSSEDSAANFSYTDNVPAAGNTYYYLVRMSKAGFSSTTSDTATISSKPLITVTAALSDFLQGIGTPSSTQGYVVSGLNILDSIKILPPVNYEVSANGGTTWFNNTTPLGLKPTNGIVANTSITLRLNGMVVGTFNNNIIHAATFGRYCKNPFAGNHSGTTGTSFCGVATLAVYAEQPRQRGHPLGGCCCKCSNIQEVCSS